MIALLCLAATSVVTAQQRRIYIAPDDHTDYMWTADEETYRRSLLKMLDYYLDQADKTATAPTEYQSRWHADGTFWIWTYEKNKSKADFARLISRIRDGHISYPLNAAVSTYGATPTEAVLRGMYYAGSLERRFGISTPLAIANEDQTLPFGLGALWAGSGATYSWKGICGCATKITEFGKRPHDIYWWVGNDGSRILMKWNALTPGRSLMGNYLEAREIPKVIKHVETDPDFRSAYPYNVIGIFGRGGDDLETLTQAFVEEARAMTTPDRKVIVSNMNDFFVDFEKTYGQSLPEYSASFGNEWDLYTASISEIAGRVRRSVERLRAAEALASLVALQRPHFLEGRQTARDLAWMSLGLFWEHDWTGDGPVRRQDRTEWGKRIAANVETYVNALHSDAAWALGEMIRSAGPNRRFYVFNPLGWQRTAVADIRWDQTDPVHVIDVATRKETPSQIITAPDETGRVLHRYLRILAAGLPSVGYKVFEVVPGQGQHFSAAAQISGNVAENSVYRVRVDDNGAIRSFVDKTQGNREFAGKSLNDLGPEFGTVEVENAGPVSVTLRATSEGPLEHTTRVTLFRDSKLLDVRNDINQNFDGTHTWSFRFNLTSPDVWHEESGAVIRAKLLADGGQYAPTMSRLDWLTLNHFADMSGSDGAGVTLSSSDLSFMKLGRSSIVDGVSRLDTKTPQISVLAGGQIDGPSLGIHKQGGDAHFLQRFGLRAHSGYNAQAAMKFALEHQNPAVTGWVGSSGTNYPEQEFSLLSISSPDVLLWALKPADDGIAKGLVARVWNLSSELREYKVSFTPHMGEAYRTTHLETDIASLPVSSDSVPMQAARSQIQTMRVVPASR